MKNLFFIMGLFLLFNLPLCVTGITIDTLRDKNDILLLEVSRCDFIFFFLHFFF